MELVRDVLDEQLVDATGRKIGKIDGIVLQLGKNRCCACWRSRSAAAPPRVAMPKFFRGLFQSLARAWTPHGGEPYRVPWNKLHFGALDVRLDMDVSTSLVSGEREAERFVRHLPGSDHGHA